MKIRDKLSFFYLFNVKICLYGVLFVILRSKHKNNILTTIKIHII